MSGRRERRVQRLTGIDDFRRAAHRRLPRMVFDYIEGGADDEFTVRANAEAFTRWQFTPRVLVDVSHRSLQIDLLGQTLSLPLLLAPTGMAGFASPEGELAAARAAETHGTRLVVSTASAYSLEEIGAGTQGSHWFQLYPWGDRGLMTELVQRAQVAGFHALCVTVDVPVTGNRERDRRNGFTTRPRVSLRGGVDLLRHPGWWSSYLRNRRFQMRNLTSGGTRDALASIQRFSDLFNPQVTWEDLAWLRQLWNGPLLVKGLSHADDAALAVSAGVDAVIVSNHGGRQLDGAAPALVQLPSIVDRVGGSVPILIDGGIRRGTDVVKALCLGATACLIGRPYLYGLAAGGRSGVESVLRCFESEIDTTLALLGCASVRDLHAGLVQPGPA